MNPPGQGHWLGNGAGGFKPLGPCLGHFVPQCPPGFPSRDLSVWVCVPPCGQGVAWLTQHPVPSVPVNRKSRCQSGARPPSFLSQTSLLGGSSQLCRPEGLPQKARPSVSTPFSKELACPLCPGCAPTQGTEPRNGEGGGQSPHSSEPHAGPPGVRPWLRVPLHGCLR